MDEDAKDHKAVPGLPSLRLAMKTHYPGDVRIARTGILDTYLLKSLDTYE